MKTFVTSIKANEGKAPEWLMFMPEGEHTIQASVNGSPGKRNISVSEYSVPHLQAALDEAVAQGRKPCLYFDHKRGAAAAYPDRFAYGENTEGKRGIMLHIANWSNKGRAAVEGSDYNGFSPLFLIDEAGRPCGLSGTTAEVGSLTNEPAFTDNARVACPEYDHLAAAWNAEAEHNPAYATIAAAWNPTTEKPTMEKYLIEKMKLKDGATVEEIKAAFDAVLDKAENPPAPATDEHSDELKSELETKNARIAELETQLAEEQKKSKASLEQAADAAIESAVAAGKIAPQNKEGKEAIKAAFMADPERGKVIIAAMSVNPALAPKSDPDPKPSNAPARSIADDYEEELKTH